MKKSEKTLEEILQEFQDRATIICNEFIKERPHPYSLPVGLLNQIENGRWETAYTRTLAYLLDNKGHGYGCKFLEAFIGKAPEMYLVCAEKALQGKEKNLPQTHQEKGRFDVFVSNCLVIEAKTVDTEWEEIKDQLERYTEELKGKTYEKICLTPNVLESDECKDWRFITWLDVADILWNVIQNPNNPETKGTEFVKYFISSIYTNLYGHNADYIDIYDIAFEADKSFGTYAEEIANNIANWEFSWETFVKYPTAIRKLYQDYTESGSKFDDCFENFEQEIKKKVLNVFKNTLGNTPCNTDLPKNWIKWVEIEKNVYFVVGIIDKMTKTGTETYDEGLYWFWYLSFWGNNRIENKQKYLLKLGAKIRRHSEELNITDDKVLVFNICPLSENIFRQIEDDYNDAVTEESK